MRKSRKKKMLLGRLTLLLLIENFEKDGIPNLFEYIKKIFFRFYCCLKNDYNILNEFLMNLTDTSFQFYVIVGQLITTVKLIG